MKKKKRRNKKVTLQNALVTFLMTAMVSAYYWYAEVEEKETLAPQVTTQKVSEEGILTSLYSNFAAGDNLQTPLSHAIHNAKQSVLLIIYSLTDPKIIAALKAKSEQGVDVRVIYDARASVGIDRKLGPKVNAIARAAGGLMHQKILVLDGKEIWIGSANFTHDSLFEQGNLVAALQSADLADLVLKKARRMSEENYEKPVMEQAFNIGDQKLELWFLPDCHERAVNRIKGLIQSAKKTIHVAMFTFTRPDFADHLIEARKRGVDVQVYLDHQSSKGASAKIAEKLKKAGVSVCTNPGKGIFHCKFLLIDNEILVNGSANWTKAAFTQNDDCFIILHKLGKEQKKQMTELTSQLKDQMVSLKLALIGHGKMGQMVSEVALEKKHQLVDLIDLADVCIDFTHPDVVLKNIRLAADKGKDIVVGTTGWTHKLDEVKEIVKTSNIGLLYSPNFSIGMQMYLKTLHNAAQYISKQDEYDVAGYEIHHREKADSPSGTAKQITKTLLNSFEKKKRAIHEPSECALAPSDLHFSSLRVGHVPGTHSVIFDSPYDSITITHQAKNRKGFACGAVEAAEWLYGKKGFYTFEEILHA